MADSDHIHDNRALLAKSTVDQTALDLATKMHELVDSLIRKMICLHQVNKHDRPTTIEYHVAIYRALNGCSEIRTKHIRVIESLHLFFDRITSIEYSPTKVYIRDSHGPIAFDMFTGRYNQQAFAPIDPMVSQLALVSKIIANLP